MRRTGLIPPRGRCACACAVHHRRRPCNPPFSPKPRSLAAGARTARPRASAGRCTSRPWRAVRPGVKNLLWPFSAGLRKGVSPARLNARAMHHTCHGTPFSPLRALNKRLAPLQRCGPRRARPRASAPAGAGVSTCNGAGAQCGSPAPSRAAASIVGNGVPPRAASQCNLALRRAPRGPRAVRGVRRARAPTVLLRDVHSEPEKRSGGNHQ
jgi:hypothetical protein